MIITFFSNYYNHHQAALCEALSKLEGVEFYFIETEPMESFRQNMGWTVEDFPDFVIKAHANEESRQMALHLSDISDVVMIGSAPEWYVEKRIAENKLTLRYTERPMKEGVIKMFIPRLAKKFYKLHFKNRKKDIFVLGASAYAAWDYSILKSYPGKCLKFGYFPEGEKLSYEELSEIKDESRTDNIPTILWMGRFLKLKRADLLIRALGEISKKNIPFRLKLIGNGEEENNLKALASSLLPQGSYSFEDFVKPKEARKKMQQSDIYVMTSNKLEGWGSVIYEALSEGCAVVASHACGCTPWLVKDKETGFVFKSGDYHSLAKKLEILLRDEEGRKDCGRNAYMNMQKNWNPQIAAKRIKEFTQSYLDGKTKLFDEGPLSRAEILKNNWYNDKE